MMVYFLICALFLYLAAATPARAENQLPSCDSATVRKTFTDSYRVIDIFELRDWKSAPDKRWCYVHYAAMVGLRSPIMEAVFTIEWVDQADGTYWMQIRMMGLSR